MSLTSRSDYNELHFQDISGMSLMDLNERTVGSIHSTSQEFRIAGQVTPGLRRRRHECSVRSVREANYDNLSQSSASYAYVGLGLPRYNDFRIADNQDADTYAVFTNWDYRLFDKLKLMLAHAIPRQMTALTAVQATPATTILRRSILPFLIASARARPTPQPAHTAGRCITADQTYTPELVRSTLDEHNISWRFVPIGRPSRALCSMPMQAAATRQAAILTSAPAALASTARPGRNPDRLRSRFQINAVALRATDQRGRVLL